MRSLKGHFLVASPHLADPNFFKTVVLMIQHDEDGAFGVIMNRPSNRSVEEIWQEVADEPCECPQPINLGGPVLGPLLAVHTQPLYSETEVVPGVFVATQRDHLDFIVRQEDQFRIFSGYAGWGAGQLENELEQGGWLIMAAQSDLVFSAADDLWHRAAQTIAADVLISSLKIKHVPDDPSLN